MSSCNSCGCRVSCSNAPCGAGSPRHPPCPMPCQCIIPMNNNYQLWAVYLGLLLQTIAFHMQHCAVNRLVNELHTGSHRFATLQSWSPVFLAIGCPFFGQMGDLLGSTFALEMSMALSSLAYILELATGSESSLILAYLPLLLVHTYLGSQMVIADRTCGGHRSMAFARLAILFKLGIVFGPSVGRYFLDNWGSKQTILLAAVISISTTVIFHLYVLEQIGWHREHFNWPHAMQVVNVNRIGHLMMSNEVFVLSWTRFSVGIPFHILHTDYRIRLVEYYAPTYEKVSFVLSSLQYSDLGLLLVWMGLMCYFRNEITLHRITLLLTFLGYLIIGFSSSFMIVTAAYFLLSCNMVFLTLVTRTVVSNLVQPHERGTALGICMMLELLLPQTPSLLRALGMVDYVVNVAAVSRFGVVITILMAVVLFVVFRNRD